MEYNKIFIKGQVYGYIKKEQVPSWRMLGDQHKNGSFTVLSAVNCTLA